MRTAIKESDIRFLTLFLWQYSGGHAQKGQGGFYGSGGARVLSADEVSAQTQQDERNKLLALAHDVDRIRKTMEELETFERLLEGEDSVSNKSIEIKNSIKKLMTTPDVIESLSNLEINGEPVWGLSTSEREMIMLAREKIADC